MKQAIKAQVDVHHQRPDYYYPLPQPDLHKTDLIRHYDELLNRHAAELVEVQCAFVCQIDFVGYA